MVPARLFVAVYGVMNLIDNSLDTFWQSEAKQPHTINMQFNRKTRLSMILFFVDFDQDESYTPQKLVAGEHSHTLSLCDLLMFLSIIFTVRIFINISFKYSSTLEYFSFYIT